MPGELYLYRFSVYSTQFCEYKYEHGTQSTATRKMTVGLVITDYYCSQDCSQHKYHQQQTTLKEKSLFFKMILLLTVVLFLSLFAEILGDDDHVSFTSCLETVPFMNGPCWSHLIVKGLGILIILGACLSKAPVMLNIFNSKSSEGLSRGAAYGEAISRYRIYFTDEMSTKVVQQSGMLLDFYEPHFQRYPHIVTELS